MTNVPGELFSSVTETLHCARRCALQTKTREVDMISRKSWETGGGRYCTCFAAIMKTMIYKPRIVLKLKGRERWPLSELGLRYDFMDRYGSPCIRGYSLKWEGHSLNLHSLPSRFAFLFCGFLDRVPLPLSPSLIGIGSRQSAK